MEVGAASEDMVIVRMRDAKWLKARPKANKMLM